MKEIKLLPDEHFAVIQEPADPIQQLRAAIEQWQNWLSSNPEPLFHADNIKEMQRPVIFFHEAMEWLSRTSTINARWFIKKGSDYVMSRWLEEDYDAY